MPRFKQVVIIVATMLCANHTQAAEPLAPLHVEMRYDGSFAGLSLGRIRVNLDANATDYRIHLDTKSRGIAAVFSDMKSVAEAHGSCKALDTCTPQFYESTEEKEGNKRWREARIRYDTSGAIIERFREPMDDPKWRPIVPLEKANTGIDPISAFIMLRPKLQHMLAQHAPATEIRTYDGARLAIMTFQFKGRTTQEIMDEDTKVIDTIITRHIIEGYTPKEQKKFAEGDPEIHIYFSDDARLLPVLITVSLGLGDLKIVLGKVK